MNVLLVDDHRLLLDGLANLLSVQDIQVVGMAYDGFEAVAKARDLKPDVILMDVRMPGYDGLWATRQIMAEMPESKIVILTTSTDEEDLFDAVKCGAYGYLLKSMDADELVECLKQAYQGVPPFSPGLAARLLSEFARLAESKSEALDSKHAEASVTGPSRKLTSRQCQVLTLVAQGYSYKETAKKLGLSPRTIKYHMAEIMTLLHLENRAQVIAYAGRTGLDNH